SLSKTLTHFYPYAGRVKDSFTIDCNDEGAIYMEAQVATDMSTVFKEPESTNLLLPLLPCDSLERFSEPSAKVMVAIQVSFFACGGITICACVDHVVADVAATATFLKIWAAVACGANDIDNDLICNRTSVCPPLDLSGFWKQFVDENKDKKVLTERLLFDGSKIASLRNEIGNGLCSYRLSRFEAVSALIWSAIMSTTTKKDETFPMVTVTVNLRNRTNPPFPQFHNNVLEISSTWYWWNHRWRRPNKDCNCFGNGKGCLFLGYQGW
ncbi:hypothetical protein QQP08_010257, partial [Theobroma cacao]